MRLEPGQSVTLRHRYRGRVWFAWPLVVVADDDRALIAVWHAGARGIAPVAYPDDRDEVLRGFAADRRDVAETEWTGPTMTILFEEGRWWMTRLLWDPVGGEFRGWYVDICRPLVRSGEHIDTTDLLVDLIIYPDRNWVWKDEDELTWARDAQVIDEEDFAQIQRARSELVAAVARQEFPFDDFAIRLGPPKLDSLPILSTAWDD